MDFKEYEKEAITTLLYPGSKKVLGLAYVTLGLNGESGEVAEKVKKLLRDADVTPETENRHLSEELRDKLILEAGDILWYVAALAHELDVSLEDIAKTNIEKLSSRKDRGKLQGSGDHR